MRIILHLKIFINLFLTDHFYSVILTTTTENFQSNYMKRINAYCVRTNKFKRTTYLFEHSFGKTYFIPSIRSPSAFSSLVFWSILRINALGLVERLNLKLRSSLFMSSSIEHTETAMISFLASHFSQILNVTFFQSKYADDIKVKRPDPPQTKVNCQHRRY